MFSPSPLKEQERLLEICLSFSESFPGEAQNPQPAPPLSHALGCPAASAKVAKERRSCIEHHANCTGYRLSGCVFLQVPALGCVLALGSLPSWKWVQFLKRAHSLFHRLLLLSLTNTCSPLLGIQLKQEFR